VISPIARSRGAKALREFPEASRPTTVATHRFVELLPAFAVTFEMAMVEFHARLVGTFRDESHFRLRSSCPGQFQSANVD
jgi:hypothetical protein